MRVRLRKYRHRYVAGHVFVAPLGGGKIVQLEKIGDESEELAEDVCYRLIGKYPENLELIKDEEPKPKAAPVRSGVSPQNKVVPPRATAAQAPQVK